MGSRSGDRRQEEGGQVRCGLLSRRGELGGPRFTDSDLFDGKTNREGWAVYAERRIASGTDLRVTFYSSDEIEDDGAKFALPSADGGLLPSGPFADSLGSADRIRVQAEVQVIF